MKTFATYTLGCKLNFSETSSIAHSLKSSGWQELPFSLPADVYVINTCSVTDHADRKCRKLVHEALNRNPQARIVVTGCLAQLRPQEVARIPGVTLVLGNDEKFNVSKFLQQATSQESFVACSPYKDLVRFRPAVSIGHRTRSFLKVQDGCDYFCAFCTIPLARGRSRSAPLSYVVDTVRELTALDVREVVLTGINLGEYGKDLGTDFFTLLVSLLENTNVERLRISSIEPNLLEDRIIRLAAESKGRIMPHFHVPLQSGSDVILQRMRRRYDTFQYRERVDQLFRFIPEASLGIDVLTGFPGETEELFEQTLAFLESIPFHYLHVFTYSERPRTTAIKLDGRVPGAVRKKRTAKLRDLSSLHEEAFACRFIGQVRPVLFEKNLSPEGFMEGYTDNYLRVASPYFPELVNQIVPVLLEKWDARSGRVFGTPQLLPTTYAAPLPQIQESTPPLN
ncbi:MAG: tRNA (N(6)-L-threonylcarbamoyladenosine(37)-C(2))-methylthiotransferase MtaB [Flavobacteriales bacterium]|nr:tRNA (N(6)-L-threonylcarbamoyladenosine(37)-C(2))-methylthiotransferase MtaB [Flavobacteriales bacterium]MCX7769307.1 tRNA (N(6)-L-threonylcarbamoyladenosine(37)-C(2))-methylthiotransferase MtaB [Flavobacteriales bacterium]MDW8410497.1 tRNA (N(6)-L-threonylcarbamoyladenosine(37)-C(2))-methylthiotransferase MtaB [Flavobacteriales bacterium]